MTTARERMTALRRDVTWRVLNDFEMLVRLRWLQRGALLGAAVGTLPGAWTLLGGDGRGVLVVAVGAVLLPAVLLVVVGAVLPARALYEHVSWRRESATTLRRNLRTARRTITHLVKKADHLGDAFRALAGAELRLADADAQLDPHRSLRTVITRWSPRMRRMRERLERRYHSQWFLRHAESVLAVPADTGVDDEVLFVYDGAPALPPDSVFIERVLDQYRLEGDDGERGDTYWAHATHLPIRRRTRRVLLRTPRRVWSAMKAILPPGYVGEPVTLHDHAIDLDAVLTLWESDGEGPLGDLPTVVEASRLLG